MDYLDIEERPDLARAQVSKTANIVDVGEDGNPPFYIAISQRLDGDTGWLSTSPRPIGSGPDIEGILERVWDSFEAQRECRSPNTTWWHVYRVEGFRSWPVQTFEIFGCNVELVDLEEWCKEVDDRNAVIQKAEDVQERRAAMKAVRSEES